MEVMELLLRGNDEWHRGTLAPRQAAEPHFEGALPHFTTAITYSELALVSCAT
jgi:hypothetical protein